MTERTRFAIWNREFKDSEGLAAHNKIKDYIIFKRCKEVFKI